MEAEFSDILVKWNAPRNYKIADLEKTSHVTPKAGIRLVLHVSVVITKSNPKFSRRQSNEGKDYYRAVSVVQLGLTVFVRVTLIIFSQFVFFYILVLDIFNFPLKL